MPDATASEHCKTVEDEHNNSMELPPVALAHNIGLSQALNRGIENGAQDQDSMSPEQRGPDRVQAVRIADSADSGGGLDRDEEYEYYDEEAPRGGEVIQIEEGQASQPVQDEPVVINGQDSAQVLEAAEQAAAFVAEVPVAGDV